MPFDNGIARFIAQSALGETTQPDWVGDGAWTSAVSQADLNKLLPALAFAVERPNATVTLPAELPEFLAYVREQADARTEAHLGLARHVARALNNVGIEPIYLKGVGVMFDGLYPDPAWRVAADIDLLVEDGQARQAWETLRRNGLPQASDQKFDHHLPALRDPDSGIVVEVHHTAMTPIRRRHHLLDGAIARAVPLPLGEGLKGRKFAPADQFAHLVAHAAMENGQFVRGRFPPRDLVESVLMAQRLAADDWRDLEKRFAKAHGRPALGTWCLAMGEIHAIPEDARVGPVARAHAARMRWRTTNPRFRHVHDRGVAVAKRLRKRLFS